MNQVNLLKIIALNGSQNFAFEELCCQLASLEPRLEGASFIRKGRGADAGVECYIRHTNGLETGWQAKFFDCFDSGQMSQLTESFKTAVEKHPQLTRYIVCLPIDLKDGRTGKNKTEGERWLDWKTTRLAELDEKRTIEIELWQATNIRERLFRHDPHYAGRMAFFFSELHFSVAWFSQKFNFACTTLGSRYTPEFHVSLPVRQTFRGINRDSWLEEQCENWVSQLTKHFNSVYSKLQKSDIAISDTELISGNTRNLTTSLNQNYPLTELYPLADWNHKISTLKENTRNCLEYFWRNRDSQEISKEDQDSYNYALNELFKFEQVLNDIENAIHSDAWQLSNEQAVLIFGEAGSGKSHLLADIAADAIKNGQPAILLIGSQFFEQDPRTQILQHLDLRNINFSTFLGALDAAGQAANIRALLMIDALNERHGINLWSEYLAPFIAEIKQYPHLALVVSCRTTYLNFIVPPDSVLHKNLYRLEHHGFADNGGYAARAYLTKRKIVRPSAPNLLPEFNNPLFLKTCCDSLDRQGLNTFPRGVQGLTQYFNFYLKALTKEIELRMKLVKREKIIERALNKLTDYLLINQSPYLPLAETINRLDSVFPSLGQQDRSLLSELEHEGIITIEPVYISANEQDEHVRFTFERFSDFQIAGYLLEQHIKGSHAFQPLVPHTPLHDFLARENIYQFAGIIEALAVLLPEQTEFEILDLSLPDEFHYRWILENAFLESLLLRRQDRFTEKTRQLVIDLSSYENHWLNTLIAISTEPDNRFNARYLHNKLISLSMPKRDADWSINIAEMNIEEGSHLDILLSWAVESGFDEIEPKRVELAAIILTWLFSTSHRTIRDKATKSLTALLASRLPLAVKLIEMFKTVDDLYILERLLASCYGATLQAKKQKGLVELTTTIYQWIFADGKPLTHLLLRDYARGIIEFTHHCGLLPADIAIDKARPPYRN
ncbi:MAG: ATP-binding protein [Methylococcales bacterium]